MGEMKERMLRGELYLADDPDIQADAARAHDLMERFNATRASEPELRDRYRGWHSAYIARRLP